MRFPVIALVLTASCSIVTAAAAQSGGQTGKPANLCGELVAYLKQPNPNQSPAAAAAPAGDAKADPKLTTAVQAPKSGEQPPKAQGNGAPTESGVSGPIPNQVGQGAPGPQGAEQKTAAPGSAPPAPTMSSTQGKVTAEQAEAMAAANDLPGCRAATQTLRRAGAPLPAGLMALGALDLKYFD